MKRLILFIAMALLPVIGSAQDKHVYSFKTGRYTIVTDMGMAKLSSVCTFADYGALKKLEMEVMGQTVVMVENGGKRYLISPSFKEMPNDEAEINYNNLTPEVIEKYSIKKLDDEQVDEYKCEVYTFRTMSQGVEADGKVWVWKGFTIKSEVSAMGTTVETYITDLKVDIPVDKSIFDLPK